MTNKKYTPRHQTINQQSQQTSFFIYPQTQKLPQRHCPHHIQNQIDPSGHPNFRTKNFITCRYQTLIKRHFQKKVPLSI